MKGRIAYRGFQEPWNRRLVEGVEPLGAAILLTPVDGAGDGPKPTVATPLLVFFVASSEAFFFAAASSAAFLFGGLLRRRLLGDLLQRSHLLGDLLFRRLFCGLLFCGCIRSLFRWTPRASLPVPLLMRQASARERLEGARRPLICPGHATSSAFAVEHRRRMIFRRRCIRIVPPSPFPCWGRIGGSTTLTTCGTCPRDLYTSGLVAPLDLCNTDIVH
jgi:hypothetical protein